MLFHPGVAYVGVGTPSEIKTEVFDMLGRCVFAEVQVATTGVAALTLEADRLAPGLYIVRVTMGAETSSHPITVLH